MSHHRAALGTAIITRDVLQSVLGELEEGLQHRGPATLSPHRAADTLSARRTAAETAALASRLAPGAECPVCAQVREMEGIYLRTLVAHLLGTEGLPAAYESSDGLCLPHLRQMLDRVRQHKVLTALVHVQSEIWRRLVGQLSEFIRKNDYRFRDEPWGDECDAWRRAIMALAGGRPEQHSDVAELPR